MTAVDSVVRKLFHSLYVDLTEPQTALLCTEADSKQPGKGCRVRSRPPGFESWFHHVGTVPLAVILNPSKPQIPLL